MVPPNNRTMLIIFRWSESACHTELKQHLSMVQWIRSHQGEKCEYTKLSQGAQHNVDLDGALATKFHFLLRANSSNSNFIYGQSLPKQLRTSWPQKSPSPSTEWRKLSAPCSHTTHRMSSWSPIIFTRQPQVPPLQNQRSHTLTLLSGLPQWRQRLSRPLCT